jgi:hypothetical protein
MTVHYTTYDVRRRRDIIHPGKTTAHCDIMGLLAPGGQFFFAHVLGIYHANVIYIGAGASDYNPRHLDFLWVRYYSLLGRPSSSSLDILEFPAVNEAESFGFIDPSCVLRCCHIIPSFSRGQRAATRVAISPSARNDRDWNQYFVNRSDSLIYHFDYILSSS